MSPIIPTPATDLNRRVTVDELKSRLDWGEPALTIIDMRDRDAYRTERIRGAVSIPQSDLVTSVAATLEPTRDIYLYGVTDDSTAAAATSLRSAGYEHVAELQGGLAAWQAAHYPIATG